MHQKEITVELRSRTGKNAARQMRASGQLPGIVYGKGIEPIPVTLSPKELAAAISGEGGQNTLLTVKGGGALDGSMVIVADLLKNPIKRTLLHVDLHKLDMNAKVKVHVPVRLVGAAAGVKEGGMLDFCLHSVDVECLPTQIPEHIDVDVTNLAIGHSIHVSDLKLESGVKIMIDGRASIVSILGKAKEEAPAAE